MRSVDTIGPAMFANSKTPSSGLSRSKPEKNCARNCRSNAQKREPPRLELAAVFLWEEFCPMESIWRNMSPTSSVHCCKNALAQSNGVQTRAADLLKVSYRSFRHLMKK